MQHTESGMSSTWNRGRGPTPDNTNKLEGIMADDKASISESQRSKARWERMRLSHVGDIRDVVQAGGGKLTPVGGDPGEMRKEKGSGR